MKDLVYLMLLIACVLIGSFLILTNVPLWAINTYFGIILLLIGSIGFATRWHKERLKNDGK